MVKSIMAGMVIAISAVLYLKTGNPILFAFGLLAIKELKWDLFTGKICFGFEGALKTFMGNTIGCIWVCPIVFRSVEHMAIATCYRFDKSWQELFLLGILCNLCIYIAVKGNIILTIFAVTAFVACGFEHSIADISYMLLARRFSYKIIFVILGNIGGGMFAQYLEETHGG